MVEILTMPSIERSLTEKERRVMWRRLQRSRSPRWRGMLVAFLVLFLPFLILGLVCGGGRLNAGDLKVLGSYALVLIAIAGWVALEERYKHRKRCRELDQALEFDKVRKTKIQSDRVWLYDEIEDEGPVYLFELREGGGVALLAGQEYYPGPRFPNTDISIMEVLHPDGRVMEMVIEKRGHKLKPERVTAQGLKEPTLQWEQIKAVVLASPGPVGLLAGSLEEVEAFLMSKAIRRGMAGS